MTTQRSMWRPPIPFPEAVARKLALENRWTHDLKRHWTVAHHLVLCQELAARDKLLPITQLWILVHDAHEAWCRDVPSFAITSEQRAFMCEEQVRLHDAWSIPEPNAAAELIIREYDLRARTAEAYTAVEDATRERWLSGNNKTECAPVRREVDERVVNEILDQYPGALDWWFSGDSILACVKGAIRLEVKVGPPSLIANEWLRRYTELRSKCGLDRADD